jgi:uncharacterized protein YodC (DUF2158 family)
MDETKFKWLPGDLVKLKSGGPAMTVEADVSDRVFPSNYLCVWFDGRKLKTSTFRGFELLDADEQRGHAKGTEEDAEGTRNDASRLQYPDPVCPSARAHERRDYVGD